MENQLMLFEHEQFGKVRVVIINGEPWFAGIDVARALGYKNGSRDVERHVPQKFRRIFTAKEMASNQESTETVGIFSEQSMGGVQRLTFISEKGLYRLILRSNLPKAEEFTDWTCEVLTTIRKTGSYSLVANPKTAPNPNRHAGQLKDACLYVFLMSDDTIKIVKIGQSANVETRKAQIARQYKLTVVDYAYTLLMPREIARLAERCCHEIFSSFKKNGEFFFVPFDTARTTINAVAKFANALPHIAEIERGKILFEFANACNDLTIKEQLAIKAANLL